MCHCTLILLGGTRHGQTGCKFAIGIIGNEYHQQEAQGFQEPIAAEITVSVRLKMPGMRRLSLDKILSCQSLFQAIAKALARIINQQVTKSQWGRLQFQLRSFNPSDVS